MPRLDGQSDVEAQVVMQAPGTGQQKVHRLPLTRAVHPDHPRAGAVVAPDQIGPRGRRTRKLFGRKRTRQKWIVVELQFLVHQPADPVPAKRANSQWGRIGVRVCHTERRQFLCRSGIPGGL